MIEDLNSAFYGDWEAVERTVAASMKAGNPRPRKMFVSPAFWTDTYYQKRSELGVTVIDGPEDLAVLRVPIGGWFLQIVACETMPEGKCELKYG